MKRTLLSLLLATSLLAPSIGHPLNSRIHNSNSAKKSIDDGWYSAIVKYTNPGTYTASRYRLNVKSP
jgi:hypothetical protein